MLRALVSMRLTGGQPMLVDITLGGVPHDFGDFIHIAGGDLLNVQLVPAGPVHFLFDDRSTQNLEDLRDLLGADDVSDTHFLGVLTGTLMTSPSDDSTDSCRYSRVTPLTVRSVMASTFAAP